MATSWPTLQVGSHGEDVRTVQYLLDVHGRSHDDATCLVVRWDGAEPGPGDEAMEG